MAEIEVTLSDGFLPTSLFTADAGSTRDASSTMTVELESEQLVAQAMFLDDVFDLGEGFSFALGLSVTDRLRLTLGSAPAATYQMFLSRTLRVTQQLAAGYTISAEDTANLIATAAAARAWSLLDQLGLAETVAATSISTRSLSDAVRLRDSLHRFFGADASDILNLTPSLISTGLSQRLLADAVAIGITQTPQLIIRAVVEEDIEVTATQLLQMIFDSRIEDFVALDAVHITPNEFMSTWCINTRAGFTTEYDNYVFNSFAKLGTRYFGATAEGLFDLTGNDDDGDDIVASLRGGFLQLNSSRLGGLAGVYVGLRGDGEFFLKLDAASGETYTYRMLARDMETSKVWVGKGLRHRYIGYELISTGQDFDLESIEFVPMLARRRV